MNCLNNCTLNSFIIKYSHKFNTTQTIIKDIIKSLKAEAACCVDCEYECAKDTLKEIIKSNHLYRIFKNILTCELELLLDYICGNINDVPTYDLQFFNGGNTTGCSNDRVSYSFILTNFSSESVPVGTTFNLQWTGLGANPVFSISTDQSFYSSATISNDGLTITTQEVINTFDMQNENIAVFLTVTFDNIGCGESEITLSLTSDNNYNITTEPATQTQTYIPQQMYSCSGNTCVEDENGQYDHPSCYGNCGGGPQQMYSCSGEFCIPDENGQYNSNNCYGNCNQLPPTMYSCSGAVCIEDENGEYNNSNCNYQCIAKYSCNGNTCIEDIDGIYLNDYCDWACEEPQFLGFITLDDIANNPVPSNTVQDWATYLWSGPYITSVNISGNQISFYGIPNPITILRISNITITDYDFSGFTYLYQMSIDNVTSTIPFNLVNSSIIYLSINNSFITSISTSGCPNMTTIVISTAPVLTTLDTSNNLLLDYVSLSYVYVLTSVNFVDNIALTQLQIFTHSLSSLDITANIALEALALEQSPFITGIDLSNNINLISVAIRGTSITSLDISNLGNLEHLYLENNSLLTDIDLSTAPNLISFYGSYTALSDIDVSNNPLLEMLVLRDTDIVSIDLTNNNVIRNLEMSFCSNFNTYILNSSLQFIIIDNTNFTSFDISNCPNLITFSAFNVPLTNIDVTNNPIITNINLFGSAISNSNDINALLAYLVSINFTGGLNIQAGTNAAPTGQGILDVATLIGNGATINTN